MSRRQNRGKCNSSCVKRVLTRIHSLIIKGQPNEDAVLCTADKTYTLRSVVLSNSVLVVTRPLSSSSATEDIVIRDQLHEVLEAVPCLPKLQRLDGLLRGREYDEGHEEDDEVVEEDYGRPVSRIFFISRALFLTAYCSRNDSGLPTMKHEKCCKRATQSL